MPESPPARDPRQVTAAHWGTAKDNRATFWRGHPAIQAYTNRRVSGNPAIPALVYVARKYFPDGLDRALSLACGHGAFERQLINQSLARSVEGVDLSPGAIEQAAGHARESGYGDRIDYFVGDFNEFELRADRYDGVFGFSAVHHCSNLEHLFTQVSRSLTDSGIFVLNEYMGPTRFQFSDLHLDLMNRMIDALPEELRISIPAQRRGEHILKRRVPRIDPEELIARDPSEAVRSEEIRPLFREYFEVLEYRPWGGSLLQHLLSGIVGNFDPENPQHGAILNSMILLEETLEDRGVLEPDCALLVGRRKLSAG